MYRQYFKTTIETDRLKEMNRNAPEGVKYCNGLCQDFRDKSIFSGVHVICNDCRNFMNLAENQINEKKITFEKLHENPDIIYGIDISIDTMKTCTTCKQDKSLSQYDYKRNECKACRAIKASERNNKDIDILISDIEKLKNNMDKLEKFVIDIPKDKLIKIISHFQIGRKATDTKSIMVNNVVEYFKKIMNPKLCRGGCGYELEEVFDICEKCKNKDKTANTKMAEFEENLEYIASNIKKFEGNDEHKYNKEQVYKIAIFIGVKAKKSHTKKVLIEMINEKLEEKEKENQLTNVENQNFDLVINGIIINTRLEDGFVNASTLCKAGNKLFKDWFKLESTKELIAVFEDQIKSGGSSTFKSVDIIKGRNGGSWIHPDLSVQVAQWVSPIFALQVSKWVREIACRGYVIAGNEKNNEQLLEIQNELAIKNKTIKDLEKKNKNILIKRQYYKLNKGCCFYILKTKDDNYKIGFEGVDINERLRTYRTLVPDIKLIFLVYSSDAFLIEQAILKRFTVKKLETNHEVLVLNDVIFDELLSSVQTLINFCNLENNVCSIEDIEKYNES